MDEVKLNDIEIVEDDDLRISPEEMLVIDFINELQLKYETDAQEQIANRVKEKFGDLGNKVLEQLSNDVNSNTGEVDECTECGKVSEEWLKKSQEKLKNVEIFLDEDTDEIAQNIIYNATTDIFRTSDIVEAICDQMDCPIDEVTDDQILAIQKKILFKGIVDGWLIDDNFVKEK